MANARFRVLTALSILVTIAAIGGMVHRGSSVLLPRLVSFAGHTAWATGDRPAVRPIGAAAVTSALASHAAATGLAASAMPTSPTACTADVLAGVAGTPTRIVVQARDADGNPRTTGGDHVVVTVSGPNNVAPRVVDRRNGTYTASYTPTHAGADTVVVTVADTAVGGSPFTSAVAPGPVKAARSVAKVAAGVAGLPTLIAIQAKDAYGNPRVSGGDQVAVVVTGANTAAATGTDNGDGTYTATYTPQVAGTDNLAITLGGSPIAGSPYRGKVVPGAPVAGNCTAVVPSGTAGVATKVLITLRDGSGNLVTAGPLPTVAITGANMATPSVINNRNGTYTANYTPTHAGLDTVAISVVSSAIQGSPFSTKVAAGATYAAACNAVVPGGIVAMPTTIVIQARDRYGNPRTTGGDPFTVAVTGTNPAAPTVTDNGNGTYGAVYVPAKKGTDRIAIKRSGASIGGSPYVSVVDTGTVLPALQLPGNCVAEASGPGGAVVTFTATATDVRGAAVPVACEPASGSLFALGATTVTATAIDRAGLKSTGAFTVVVQDTTPPTVSAADVSVEATTPDGTAVDFAPAAKDAVDPAPQVVCNPASGSRFGLGATTVSVTATDSAGNITRATLQVNVTDMMAPTIAASDVVVEATGPDGAAVPFAPIVTDAGDSSPDVVCTPASGATFPVGATPVSVKATDHAGNSAEATFTVTVRDMTPPILSLPASLVLEAVDADGAPATFVVSATDLVDGAVTANADHASGSKFPIGTTTVTVSATDAAGNVAQATFQVTVRDRTAPLITAPADQILEAAGPDGAVATFTASATDLVDGVVAVRADPASGSVFPIGTTTVLVSAKDRASNIAETSFQVTVRDTQAPVLSLPADIAAAATGPNGAVVTFTVTATDVVDGDVHVTCEPASGSLFALGTTTVRANATDSHGNTASGSFHVTVSDSSAPGLNLPGNMTVEATGPDGATVRFETSATDVVDGTLPVICAPASGSVFPLGTTTVTASATNSGQATATGSFTVTVADTTAPALTLPVDVIVATTDPTGEVVTFVVTATDAVTANPVVTCMPASGSRFPVGVTTVNVTATDAAGNQATGSLRVTVQGITQLVFTTQPATGQVHTPLAPVQVALKDAGGATLPASGLPVTLGLATGPTGATLTGALTAATVNGVATFGDLQLDQVYAAYQLGATMEGLAATSTPFAVGPGPTDTAHCTATVPDGVAGNPTVMTIVAKDSWGNPRTTGGDVFVVTVTGSNTATATVTDNHDGTYAARYTPLHAGTDYVSITRGGQPIAGSPFTSLVTAGASSAVTSTAVVPNGTTGVATVISVQAMDANGNRRTTGGDSFTVSVSGTNPAAPAVTDHGNGTYTAQYVPAQEGTDSVAIALAGTAITGSPFPSLVLSAEATVTLVSFSDAWPLAKPRYMDIADRIYNSTYVSGHPSTSGTIQFKYKLAPGKAYLVGWIRGSGLKPNFCYQMKMGGKPGAASGGLWPGAAADKTTNDYIIQNARWWGYETEKAVFSTGDAAGAMASQEYADGYIAGYVYTGYFLTDRNGTILCTDLAGADSNGWVPVSVNRCFHITGKKNQSIGQDTTPVNYTLIQSGAAYTPYSGTAPVRLWYEKEPKDPTMTFSLPTGRHDVVLMITEESFHNSYGGGTDDPLGGVWDTVFVSDWSTANSPVSNRPWIAAHGGAISFTTP